MAAARAVGAPPRVAEWLFGLVLLGVAVANVVLVHPVPAMAYLVASLLYLPPASAWLQRRLGLSIHPVVKVGLGIAVAMFTLGVSDLGDRID